MRESTVTLIQTVLQADPEVTPEHLRAVLTTCKGPALRRKLILAKDAMQILGVSRPTLRRLTDTGRLALFRPTPRKSRFDLAEVERLAYETGVAK